MLLHRAIAVVGEDSVDIKAARGTVLLPLVGLLVTGAIGYWMTAQQGAPLWLLVGLLFVCLGIVPVSVMGLVSGIAGADVVADARKGSVTFQQGYLGMGLGTKELVPFAKIDHIEVSVEGDQPDRWHEESDDVRQFALTLVKQSGKRLKLAQVPVPAGAQNDGMDRTLAVAQAFAQVTGARVELPPGWALVEVDAATLEPVAPAAAPARTRRRRR